MLFIKKSMQNLYLENMNKIFTKNHNFNALRKFDIFFQTESTFERNEKKTQQEQEKSWPRWSIHLYVLIY